MNIKAKAARDLLESIFSQQLPKNADFGCIQDLDLTEEQRAELTYDDVFWIQLVQKSLHGDMKATQEILDRRYGKAPQHILQENRNYNYTDFLEQIAEEEHELQPPEIVINMPQIQKNTPPDDGGSSGDSILEDLGLLH